MEKVISKSKKEMERAARNMDFMGAARLREDMFKMQKELEDMR
jgi:excinuclease ABC subunit B